MPKKNNQNKPNGFMMYAEEIKTSLLMEGHSIRSKPDLITAASPKWQLLPEDEKEFYKDKAKWEWENRHLSGGNRQKKTFRSTNRRDNMGDPLSQRVDLIKINEDKRKREREDVFLSFEPGKGVLPKKFFFVGFISLLDEPTEHGWPPLEIAAIEFSLQNGIERFWHKFVNPVCIPQGYRYKAQHKSDNTHLIDPDGRALPYEKYTNIYDELFNFLSRGTQIIPPIYSRMSEIERVEGCLKYLAENAGRPNQLKRLYELEGLILDLDAHLRGDPQSFIASKQAATDLLSSTMFDFDNGTRCDWHEENESKHCALGIVNRYCYCMGDYFCKEFDIPISERHLPRRNEACYTLIPSTNDRLMKKEQQMRKATNRSCDIAAMVAERLKIEADRQTSDEQAIQDELITKQHQQDAQKKRWIQLRGGSTNQNQSGSTNQTNHQGGSTNQSSYLENSSIPNRSPSQVDSNNIRNENNKVNGGHTVGRGRGRAQILMKNLRKPGEKPCVNNATTIVAPPPGFNRIDGVQNQMPPMGRGAKIQMSLESDKLWAGFCPPPAASSAPAPPSAWMNTSNVNS